MIITRVIFKDLFLYIQNVAEILYTCFKCVFVSPLFLKRFSVNVVSQITWYNLEPCLRNSCYGLFYILSHGWSVCVERACPDAGGGTEEDPGD